MPRRWSLCPPPTVLPIPLLPAPPPVRCSQITHASVPSYMRATNNSGAKASQRQRQRAGAPSSASALPARQRRLVRVATTRGKVLLPSAAAAAALGMVWLTCSSAMEEAKFPGTLDLPPGGTDNEGPAAMRVYPYTYSSLNGHTHAPPVPLQNFLSRRRRLIKTRALSMKCRDISAFRFSSNIDVLNTDSIK